MLSSNYRLKKKKDFTEVYKKGKKIYSHFFLMKFMKNNLDTYRIGFVVSKRIVLKIVSRNKLKRRMREAVKFPQKSIKGSYDIIVIAKPSAADQDYKIIKNDLKKLFEQANLLNNGKNSFKIN
jgi:ribonuclease P protein component